MLVLSRKTGEGITIDQEVEINILSIDGDRVRVGIQAPREIRIYRKELLDATVGVNRAAINTPVIKLSEE